MNLMTQIMEYQMDGLVKEDNTINFTWVEIQPEDKRAILEKELQLTKLQKEHLSQFLVLKRKVESGVEVIVFPCAVDKTSYTNIPIVQHQLDNPETANEIFDDIVQDIKSGTLLR